MGNTYGRFLCFDKINPTTCFGNATRGWVTQLFHFGKTPNLSIIRSSPLRRHYGVETTIGANQPRFTFDQGKHWDHVRHTSEIRGLCLMKGSREILKKICHTFGVQSTNLRKNQCVFFMVYVTREMTWVKNGFLFS